MDSEVISPAQSPHVPPRIVKDYNNQLDNHPISQGPSIHRSATTPKDLMTGSQHGLNNTVSLSPSSSSPNLEAGYTPNALYATKTQYRNQMYPTFSSRSHSSCSNQSEYENMRGSTPHLEGTGSQDSGFSSTNNMYNVNSRRTSRYESNEEIKSPEEPHYHTLDAMSDDKMKLKQTVLDGYKVMPQQNYMYGSLERNLPKKHNNKTYERKLSDSESDVTKNDMYSSKYGSKRTSQSDYDLSSSSSSSRSGLVEVPVAHEQPYSDNYGTYNYRERKRNQENYNDGRYGDDRETSNWQNSAVPDPSPVIKSPQHSFDSDSRSVGGDSRSGGGDNRSQHSYGSDSRSVNVDNRENRDNPLNCYSPRGYEGTYNHTRHTSTPYVEHTITIQRLESPYNAPQAASSVVTVTKRTPNSPHVEVTKPFETSDFIKYSERLRRQRLVEQYQQKMIGSPIHIHISSQHSPDSAGTHSSSTSQRHHSHQASRESPSRGQMSGTNSPFGSPVSSRHMTSPQFTPQHRRDSEQSNYSGRNRGDLNSVSSTTSSSTQHIVKERSTSRVQYTVQTSSSQGRVIYKSRQQTSTHSQYQPPTPMKCDPVKKTPQAASGSNRSTAPSSAGARLGQGHQQGQVEYHHDLGQSPEHHTKGRYQSQGHHQSQGRNQNPSHNQGQTPHHQGHQQRQSQNQPRKGPHHHKGPGPGLHQRSHSQHQLDKVHQDNQIPVQHQFRSPGPYRRQVRQAQGNHQRQMSHRPDLETSQLDRSFLHLSPPGGLSRAFSEEMIAWYDDKQENKPPTLV